MRGLPPSVPEGCSGSGQVLAVGLVGRQREPEGEGAVHDEDWGHEEEHVKTHKIVPTDALRGPGAVVVVALDADVAVGAVDSPAGDVESAFPAISTLGSPLHCSPLAGFLLLHQRPGDPWVAECHGQVRQSVSDADDFGDDVGPLVLGVVVDVIDDQTADGCEEDEGDDEADVYDRNGSTVRAQEESDVFGVEEHQVFAIGETTLLGRFQFR